MTKTGTEPDRVQLALLEIAEARARLRQANDILSEPQTSSGAPPAAASAEGQATHDQAQSLLEIAQTVIEDALPRQLERQATQAGASPRDWLEQVCAVSIAPRGFSEPVATLVVMLAAVKFGLRHQLLLQTETRLGLPHKTPIPNLDIFLETFIAEMIAADRGDARLNDWLKRVAAVHYPGFRHKKRLGLPSGDVLILPAAIAPIPSPGSAPLADSGLTSPVDPASAVVIPPGSGWLITLAYGEILLDEAYPAFHGKRHSGIDIFRWQAHKSPVYAMRAGAVIESVYLPKGFGNTVVIEHADGSCLRYTHLDRMVVRQGESIVRGAQIGTIGKGANNVYAPHLHLDMPRTRAYARARTYYDRLEEVAERFIDPLSQIQAGV